MELVRDKAILAAERHTSGLMENPCDDWLSDLPTLDRQQLESLRRILRMQTDQVLAELLGAISDEHGLGMTNVDESGRPVDAASVVDDIASALHGEEGWVCMFSKYPNEGE